MGKNLVSSKTSSFIDYVYYYDNTTPNTLFEFNFMNEYSNSFNDIKKIKESDFYKNYLIKRKNEDEDILELFGIKNMDPTDPETQRQLNLKIYEKVLSSQELNNFSQKEEQYIIIYLFNRYIHDKNIIAKGENDKTIYKLLNLFHNKNLLEIIENKNNMYTIGQGKDKIEDFWKKSIESINEEIGKSLSTGFVNIHTKKNSNSFDIEYTENFFEQIANVFFFYFSTNYNKYLDDYAKKAKNLKVIEMLGNENNKKNIKNLFKNFFESSKNIIISTIKNEFQLNINKLAHPKLIRGVLGESIADIIFKVFLSNNKSFTVTAKKDTFITGSDIVKKYFAPADLLIPIQDKDGNERKIRIQSKEYKIDTLQNNIPNVNLSHGTINFTGDSLYYYFPEEFLKDIRFLIGNLHMNKNILDLDVTNFFQNEIEKSFYAQALGRIQIALKNELSGNDLFFVSGTFFTASYFLNRIAETLKSKEKFRFEEKILSDNDNTEIRKRFINNEIELQKINNNKAIKSNLIATFSGLIFSNEDFVLWPDNYIKKN